jgi:putative cardiolipin synthase
MTSLPAPTTSASSLQRAAAPLLAANPGRDGVYPLADGPRACVARLLLAERAERTLDLQYYIWHGDRTGMLLFDAVRRAADRGVRVRLLLDDTNTWGVEPILATLDAHPCIEVRLFNPLRPPRWRLLGLLTDFRRLNRRMHNKSFTVDGTVTIVGGRNIGDEYFDAAHELAFVDLDVLSVGPAAAAVGGLFERYWNSLHAVPLARLLGTARLAARVDIGRRAAEVLDDPDVAEYRRILRTTTLLDDLLAGALPFEWTTVQMVADEPSKIDAPPRQVAMLARLQGALGAPREALHIVSSYFVPTRSGVRAFAELASRGVRVRVLTNALEATDVAAVHAGYARYRRDLLRAGVALYELRREGPRPRAGSARVGLEASAASLHAKTFAVDGERTFVGSFNLDPRSAALNTEMGLVIESHVLARGVARSFDEEVPTHAYEVRLASDRRSLRWVERRATGTVVHEREPGASLWRRASVRLLSWLPVEWLL